MKPHGNSVFIVLGAIVVFRMLPFPNPIAALVKIPWGAMACCGLISAVLVLAAAAVVERKRY